MKTTETRQTKEIKRMRTHTEPKPHQTVTALPLYRFTRTSIAFICKMEDHVRPNQRIMTSTTAISGHYLMRCRQENLTRERSEKKKMMIISRYRHRIPRSLVHPNHHLQH